MPLDSIPQFSLGTAALIIFGVCAGFVMLRGMTRMLIGTLVLALSAWLGFLVWQKAPTLSVEWFGKSLGLVTTGLPVASFITSFVLTRKIAKAIARPFGKSPEAEKEARVPLIGLAVRLLCSLIPASLLWLIGATFLHHTDAIAELRAFAEKPAAIEKPKPGILLNKEHQSFVKDALPESWFRILDPLAEPSRLTLAKLIAAQSDSPPQPVINPQTGRPIPRAIIVSDPELQNLAREGKFGTLLRHPRLTQALNDPAVKKLLNDLSL